jgi:hypothetical protein
MTKTLIYIPRMFTQKEFKDLVGTVPEDFDHTTREFWDYINEKLKIISSRIRWVYSTTYSIKKGSPIKEEAEIVNYLIEEDVHVQSVGDPVLLAEAKAWLKMMKTSSSQAIFELYEETSKEIGKDIVDQITKTLKDGEMGILIISSNLQIAFPKEIKIIRMLPFNPVDYLNRYLAKSNI